MGNTVTANYASYTARLWRSGGILVLIPFWLAVVVGQDITHQADGWEQQLLCIAAAAMIYLFSDVLGRCYAVLGQMRQAGPC